VLILTVLPETLNLALLVAGGIEVMSIKAIKSVDLMEVVFSFFENKLEI
jgi:hypothetical protein